MVTTAPCSPAAIARAFRVARTGATAVILALGGAAALVGWGLGQAAPYLRATQQQCACEAHNDAPRACAATFTNAIYTLANDSGLFHVDGGLAP